MASPIIGLTTGRDFTSETIRVNEAYVRGICQAGGTPVLIPLGVSEQSLAELAAGLDGILFTGGVDVEPARYGADNEHPHLGKVDKDRDRVELYLYPEALRLGLPFLGICRGIQLINVAGGGTLYIDIPAQVPGAIRHDYDGYPRKTLAHYVDVVDDRLRGILGSTREEVTSFHHQAVEKLGSAFRATAYAPDGLIEALDLPGYPFGLAVQWHPECMLDVPSMQRLFRAFVQAAEERKR
jgi:putative glutamine amidotransferase